MSRAVRAPALALALVAAAAGAASGQEALAVGLFAPTVPFDGPVARLDYASRLAAHLAPAVGATKGVGRAYARAADFAAAVKRGEIQFAAVDAAYVAALGVPYQVVAVAARDGRSETAWELVAVGPATSVLDLRGQTVALPAIGAREDAFLANVLLEGELGRSFFGGVFAAPDAPSALAALETGRARAALVPAGLALPAGARRLATLAPVALPVLVALPGARPEAVQAVGRAVAGFQGAAPLPRFARGGADAVQALKGRFGPPRRRGPLPTPTLRFAADKLLLPRDVAIERSDPALLVAEPSR